MDVRGIICVFYGSIKILECGCGDATWGLTVIAKFENGWSACKCLTQGLWFLRNDTHDGLIVGNHQNKFVKARPEGMG